jgi:hypothetical protein
MIVVADVGMWVTQYGLASSTTSTSYPYFNIRLRLRQTLGASQNQDFSASRMAEFRGPFPVRFRCLSYECASNRTSCRNHKSGFLGLTNASAFVHLAVT